MGRPKKIGLDYFSMDTNWDTAMRLLKAKFGLLGIGCMVELYKTIYQEGYYVSWDADAKLLFSVEHHIDIETLDSIISEAILRGMFASDMLKTYRILTSRGIQKRWKHIMDSLKRSVCDMDFKYDLLTQKQIEGQNFDKNVVNLEDTPVSPEETPVDSGFSAQRKGKERKGKERIEKTTRHKYGLYSNILLSDQDYLKLSEELVNLNDLIEKMSTWCKANGKTYKDYAAALRNWAKREPVDKPKKKQDDPWINF